MADGRAVDWLFTLAGVLMLALLAKDAYSTVFVPRGPAGPVSARFYRGAWAAWSFAVRQLASEESRRVWLSRLGPLLVPLTLLLWSAQLIVGFALIFYPRAGTFITPDGVGGFPQWGTAFYYSAYSATTLGVGDIYPRGLTLRIVSTVEAAGGFALFSFAISYLISIYSALSNATSQAVEIWNMVGRQDGNDPVDVLIAATRDAETERDLVNLLSGIATRLAMVSQSGGQFPLVRYFHESDNGRALPLAIADLLELLTLCRAVIDPRRYPSLAAGIVSSTVWRVGRDYATQSAQRAGTAGDLEATERDRATAYRDARRRLQDAGVSLRDDDAAWAAYATLRAAWDHENRRHRESLGYPTTLH
jgi:hypothetical protein